MKNFSKEDKELLASFAGIKDSLAKCKDKLGKMRAKKCKASPKTDNLNQPIKASEDMEDSEEEDNMLGSVEDLCECCDSLSYSVDYINQSIKYIYSCLSDLDSAIYGHTMSGHLPKLSPSQLTALLKAAGADKDYKVEPKIIYANKQFNIG